MKRLTLLSGLAVACVCLLLPSCSKSLTDVGYEPGYFGTTNPCDVPLRRGNMDMSASFFNQTMTFIPSRFSTSDGLLGTNTNMGGIDKKLLEETAKKQCVKFARKFYTSLLSPKFQAEKFSKKYRSSCLRMLNEAVDSAATASDRYKGWQIFNDGNLEPNAAVSVTYDGGAWFKISQADNPDACVYVLMIVPDVKKDPKIAGIKYQSGQIIPKGV